MKRALNICVLAVLALAIAAAPVLSQPITVSWGNDGWVTPANSSQIDLGVFPIDTFFGPGSVISPQIVTLSGVKLDATNLGSIDTLLERPAPSVTFTTFPQTLSFPVEIKALRLRGNTSINGVSFQLTVALSSTPSGSGIIHATRLKPDGGRFNSSFPVLPKLTFIEVGNPGNRVDIDCAVATCPSTILNASNVCWLVAFGPNGFDPATKGITPIRAGIPVDGNFDGANDYVTVGRKPAGAAGLAFHIGYDPTPPLWPLCGPVQHDHAVYSLTHVSKPPTDCRPTQTTTTTTTTTQTTNLNANQVDYEHDTDVGGGVVVATPLCPPQVVVADPVAIDKN